jgi:hypothetical protein
VSIKETLFLIAKLKRFSVAGLLFCDFVDNVGLRCYILRWIEGFGIILVDLFANLKGLFFLKLNFILKLFLLVKHFFYIMFSWNAGHRHGVCTVDILWVWRRFYVCLGRLGWDLGSIFKHHEFRNIELNAIKIDEEILF